VSKSSSNAADFTPPPKGRLVWRLGQFLSYLYLVIFHRWRAVGLTNFRRTHGPTLIIANHQSFLDPPAIGVGTHHRPVYMMARKTLWDHPIVAKIITPLLTIPVDQDNPDVRSMKQSIAAIKAGHGLIIYPEGQRTFTGEVGEFSSGVLLLIKRAKPNIVPAGIAGAFEAWPRTRKFPRIGKPIAVSYGQAIPADEILSLGNEAALEKLRELVIEQNQIAKDLLDHQAGLRDRHDRG